MLYVGIYDYVSTQIGNTYAYTQTLFQSDMQAAKTVGIDGFALNVGSDTWTWARVTTAYAAANVVGFKLFISFDIYFISVLFNFVSSVGFDFA